MFVSWQLKQQHCLGGYFLLLRLPVLPEQRHLPFPLQHNQAALPRYPEMPVRRVPRGCCSRAREPQEENRGLTVEVPESHPSSPGRPRTVSEHCQINSIQLGPLELPSASYHTRWQLQVLLHSTAQPSSSPSINRTTFCPLLVYLHFLFLKLFIRAIEALCTSCRCQKWFYTEVTQKSNSILK